MKTSLLLKNISRYTLLILGMLVFLFALFSGAEDEGKPILGILKNSPNALPWLLLLILIWITWNKPLVGGILFSLFGLAAMIFFVIMGNHFFLSTFILTLLILVLGMLQILSAYLQKKEKKS